MIEYGLSKQHLKELKRFGHIFNKNQDKFVLDCILVILCEWNEDRDVLVRMRNDISEIDFSIDLPKDVEDDLYEYTEMYDLTIHDMINGIVGVVLNYLDLNWSGEYGLDHDDMTDQEKVSQLTRENTVDNCWIKLFENSPT